MLDGQLPPEGDVAQFNITEIGTFKLISRAQMSEHIPFMSLMFLHPLIGMLKFCFESITSAMSSASFYFCPMASIFFFQKKLSVPVTNV